MATYNRPGVYLEEVPTSFPISTVPTATAATFIGALARGPLDATLISSWSQFSALYGDVAANAADPDVATAVYLFFANGGSLCYVQRVVVTITAVSTIATTNSTSLSVVAATGLSTSDGVTPAAGAIAKGMAISGIGIPAGTTITNVSSTTLTLSQSASVPATTVLTISSPVSSSVSLLGNTTSGTKATLGTQTPTFSGNSVTLTTSAAHTLKVGQTVVIAGTASSTATPTTIYNGTFVVTAVPSSTTFTVVNPLTPSTDITTAGTVTAQSTQAELTLTAKNPGVWSNSLYYEISNSTSSSSYPGKYFNLAIYSGGTSSGYIVERFSDITLNSSDSNYAVAVINATSNYVVASDPNATNHTAANFSTSNTPLSVTLVTQSGTSTVATSNSSTVVLSTDPGIHIGMFVYGSGVTNGTTVTGYNSGTKTVTLSASMTIPAGSALTFVNAALTGGSDGVTVNNTAIASTSSLAKLDVITTPILLNAPGVTAATDVNNMLTYAYNRGDVFVIIDPTQTTSDVTSQLALANSYTGGPAGSGALGFGAVYFPNLTIPSPTSSIPGATAIAYPGGAIAAKYVTTDSSRGVFKSPAGLEARLSGVVSVQKLTNQELDYLNNGSTSPNTLTNATPVNAIRYISGSGIVVMGARTLNTGYSSKYISVRRSLIYLRKLLTDLTSFAVFETNDQRLWNRLQTTCEAALISFWQVGGLKGATAADAFYVKCDGTINTSGSIASGEVHLEIGVALQRPAEFVVIRISQYDSGSVVTVL